MIALHKKILFKLITSESGTNCLKKNYFQLNMKHFFTKYCSENRVMSETIYNNAIHKTSKCRADIPCKHRVAEERGINYLVSLKTIITSIQLQKSLFLDIVLKESSEMLV